MKPWSLLMGELDTAIQVAIAAARSDEFDVRQEAEGTLRRAVQSVAAHQPVNTTEYEERLLISGQLMNLCHGADMDWLEPMALALSERPGDDLFSASAAGSLEGGEIELVAVGAPPADWPPARRFWNSFLIADPGDLSPLGGVTSTPRSLSRWASDVNLVFASTPESAGDFLEKLKVFACYALCRSMRKVPGEAEFIRHLLSDLASSPAEDFAQLLAIWPAVVSEEERSRPPEVDPRIWGALRLVSPQVRRRLDDDYRTIFDG